MFNTEKELVELLSENFEKMCTWDVKHYQTTILQEVNLGFGIADIVISKLENSLNQKQVELNYFDINIYKIVEDYNAISIKEIQNITKANKRSIFISLNKLILENYIINENDIYKLLNNLIPNTYDTVAIEAKLRNWKRALNQAYRYKWFAYYSYVVLDSKHINPAMKNIQEFKRLNVGLATININGLVEILFTPWREKPIDYKMQLLLSEQISTYHFANKKDFQ